MYGKVLVASGSAYFLVFEHHVLPRYAGLGVLVMSGMVVATDVMADGPEKRVKAFVQRCERRLTAKLDQAERAREIREAAREELRINHGIRMAEELTDADREWLREQAALTIKDYQP